MFTHYFKVAIRNLFAHKTQTLVSLFGLAIAFACVSLAAYWNHYERTYDSFQDNADRIYCIREKIAIKYSYAQNTPESLHRYLKENYPEIEASCLVGKITSGASREYYQVIRKGLMVSVNETTYPTLIMPKKITPEALEIFNFEWVAGDKNIAAYGDNQIAISEQLAQALCGNKSPLGQTMKFYDIEYEDYTFECEIVGVYKTRTKHSTLKFDVIMPAGLSVQGYTYVLLKPGVNHEQFIKKVQTDTIRQNASPSRVYSLITPLSAMHYTYPEEGTNVNLEDVTLFSSSAVLLALCALLNYLILFVSRLRARGRDMALRTICGSSAWQTSGLLLTEYLLLLLSASLVGMLFVELVMREFVELAMIQIAFSSVMVSSVYLMLFSVILSVLLSMVPILYFKRKTLLVQIEATPVGFGKNYFRSIGVCVQLVVGILFIFCTTVMMKQVYMLTGVDNIERKQVAYVSAYRDNHDLVRSILQQQPFIKDFISVVDPLYPPKSTFLGFTVSDWEGKSAEDGKIRGSCFSIKNEIARFYSLKMKDGPSTFDLGENEIFINETLAKEMNVNDPIGMTINGRYRIKGVIYDYQVQNPNTPPQSIVFISPTQKPGHVVFKYDGDWNVCKETIKKELKQKGVEGTFFADGEEYYQYFLKSEYNLLKLLGVITVVSILIAIFGIYALIMQSCDQHRKEIAIRKVHGAGVMDILLMFFKQYMMQVVVAAVIAFPIGYYLMKNWLEQYARQTSISLWIYLCIFLGISLLVTICIGWRVWKAANENPAWVIKKE